MGFVSIALLIALAAVVVVLFGGFANMVGKNDPNRSQILMRWRVGLQFVAVLIMLAILLFRR